MKRRCMLLVTLALIAHTSHAGIDKVYGPTVEAGEIELEMRGIYAIDSNAARDGAQKSKIALGYGIRPRIFVEGYLLFEKPANGDYTLEAYELETKFQLTEQGHYFADFGLLTEFEKTRGKDAWEFKIGPLIQKPFGNWMGTVNLLGETKFGNAASNSGEWEFLGSAQLKYLLSPRFEPGLEFYTDDDTRALGPVMVGRVNFNRSRMKWELGWLLGLNSGTADNTVRWQFELEF